MSRKTLVAILCVAFAILIVIGSIAFLKGLGCESKVERAFRKLHPDYEVIYVQGDGNDTPIVTYVILFRKPGDNADHFLHGGTVNTKTGQCEVTPNSREF